MTRISSAVTSCGVPNVEIMVNRRSPFSNSIATEGGAIVGAADIKDAPRWCRINTLKDLFRSPSIAYGPVSGTDSPASDSPSPRP